jgi:hypothetical protein
MKQIATCATIVYSLLVSTNSFSQIITTFAGIGGAGGYNGNGIPATSAQLYNPNSVKYSAIGHSDHDGWVKTAENQQL